MGGVELKSGNSTTLGIKYKLIQDKNNNNMTRLVVEKQRPNKSVSTTAYYMASGKNVPDATALDNSLAFTQVQIPDGTKTLDGLGIAIGTGKTQQKYTLLAANEGTAVASDKGVSTGGTTSFVNVLKQKATELFTAFKGAS